MCGVPWHAVEGYVAQLIDKGYHVAICDQTEDPKAAKGLVKRAVTRVITPGTVLEDANLASKSHNFLGALCPSASGGAGGLAWADISTGQWSGVEFKREAELWQWAQNSPRANCWCRKGSSRPNVAFWKHKACAHACAPV
jgi:Mismatch repair ATPase (MutS family)